jgi:hypothetical protein
MAQWQTADAELFPTIFDPQWKNAAFLALTDSQPTA